MQYDAFNKALKENKWEDLIIVIQTLREAVGVVNMYITPQTIMAMGIIPDLISLLSEEFTRMSNLQSEAAWLIANVASGDTETTVTLVELGAISVLIQCLQTKNEDLHENVIKLIIKSRLMYMNYRRCGHCQTLQEKDSMIFEIL